MLVFLSLLRSPLVWVAAAVVVTGLVLGLVYRKGEKTGAAEVTVKVQQRTIEVQRSITDAEAKGPRTSRDVSKRLRDGSF